MSPACGLPCNSAQSHAQILFLFPFDWMPAMQASGTPTNTVADPGGGSRGGPESPYQIWRLFDSEILKSTGSYISF